MREEEAYLIERLEHLAITKRNIEAEEEAIKQELTELTRERNNRTPKRGFSGFQLGDNLHG